MANLPTKIGIVGGRTMFRLGLAACIQASPEIDVVLNCGEDSNALNKVRELKNSGVAMDVLLVGIQLLMRNGLSFITAVREKYPQLKVCVFDASDIVAATVVSQKAGADGVLCEHSNADDVDLALKALLRGTGYWPRLRDVQVVESQRNGPNGSKAGGVAPIGHASRPSLTPREVEIFYLLGGGKRTKQIADALGLSKRTVDVHRGNINRKLGIRTGSHTMRLAILADWAAEPDQLTEEVAA